MRAALFEAFALAKATSPSLSKGHSRLEPQARATPPAGWTQDRQARWTELPKQSRQRATSTLSEDSNVQMERVLTYLFFRRTLRTWRCPGLEEGMDGRLSHVHERVCRAGSYRAFAANLRLKTLTCRKQSSRWAPPSTSSFAQQVASPETLRSWNTHLGRGRRDLASNPFE